MVLVLLLVLAADGLVGSALKNAVLATRGFFGPAQAVRLIRSDAEGLIMGNSRAGNMVPSLLGRELGMRFFNGTAPGQDIRYQIIALDERLKRAPPPAIIIYELDRADLEFRSYPAGVDPVEIMSFLYAESTQTRRILDRLAPFNWARYLSRSFQVNGVVIPLVIDWLRPVAPSVSEDGFRRLDGRLDEAACHDLPVPGLITTDPFKIELLREFVAMAKAAGTVVTFTVSPIFLRCLADYSAAFEPAVRLFRDLDVPFHSYVTDLQDARFYHDANHLNVDGAFAFTRMLVEGLSPDLQMRLSASRPD